MKRFLIILLLFVGIVSAIGLYQGWFKFSKAGGDQGSKTNLNLEIDRGKMREDAAALSSKAKELTDNFTDSK